MFSAKALFEIITPFEFDVVPDVKINTLNSSGSISILLKLSSPDSTNAQLYVLVETPLYYVH